jgi:hypothetical protein
VDQNTYLFTQTPGRSACWQVLRGSFMAKYQEGGTEVTQDCKQAVNIYENFVKEAVSSPEMPVSGQETSLKKN